MKLATRKTANDRGLSRLGTRMEHLRFRLKFGGVAAVS